MTFDWATHLGAVDRSVAALKRGGKDVRAVTLTRAYDTAVEDLWDAATNNERLPHWFARVSGDLKPGGRFKIKGNAGGTIERCEPPSHLALTWEFGDEMNRVEAQVEKESDARSRLTFKHIVPVNDHWKKYGPGAVGIGWDLALMGLAHHLSGDAEKAFDGQTFVTSQDGKDYMIQSSDKWKQADIAAGEELSQATAAARETAAFYTGGATEGV